LGVAKSTLKPGNRRNSKKSLKDNENGKVWQFLLTQWRQGVVEDVTHVLRMSAEVKKQIKVGGYSPNFSRKALTQLKIKVSFLTAKYLLTW
jgi:hypothetical protein